MKCIFIFFSVPLKMYQSLKISCGKDHREKCWLLDLTQNLDDFFEFGDLDWIEKHHHDHDNLVLDGRKRKKAANEMDGDEMGVKGINWTEQLLGRHCRDWLSSPNSQLPLSLTQLSVSLLTLTRRFQAYLFNYNIYQIIRRRLWEM